jgi:hypothetical protein
MLWMDQDKNRANGVFGVLIYGALGGELVFIDEAEVAHFRALREALDAATWGEFRASLEAAEPGLYSSLFEQDVLPEDRYSPDDPFDSGAFLESQDYDWPPGLTGSFGALPIEVTEQFGERITPRLSDARLIYRPEDEAAITAALDRLGILTRRDDGEIGRIFA